MCPHRARQDGVRPEWVPRPRQVTQIADTSFFARCAALVNFLIFQGFLLYIHYMRENAERRLYTLRDQLKVQFRATQKAQVNERKASDSKRRLTSYVLVRLMHE